MLGVCGTKHVEIYGDSLPDSKKKKKKKKKKIIKYLQLI